MKVSVRMAIMSHLSDLQDRLRFSVNPSRSDRQTYIEVNRVKAMLNRWDNIDECVEDSELTDVCNEADKISLESWKD